MFSLGVHSPFLLGFYNAYYYLSFFLLLCRQSLPLAFGGARVPYPWLTPLYAWNRV
jgi:hypothetical protein